LTGQREEKVGPRKAGRGTAGRKQTVACQEKKGEILLVPKGLKKKHAKLGRRKVRVKGGKGRGKIIWTKNANQKGKLKGNAKKKGLYRLLAENARPRLLGGEKITRNGN